MVSVTGLGLPSLIMLPILWEVAFDSDVVHGRAPKRCVFSIRESCIILLKSPTTNRNIAIKYTPPLNCDLKGLRTLLRTVAVCEES